MTIALGSTLAKILLLKEVSVAQGVAGLALLVGLQYLVTWLAVRSRSVSGLVKAQPRLLLFSGEFRVDA